MIMAAGVGSRLDPLTQGTPKPLIPIANKPIMELILRHLKSFGINDVIANTHFLADQIHEKFGQNNELGINFNYVYEPELSGTAGGVKKCEFFFDDTFVVISGDALTNVNLKELIEKHKSSGAVATMALREVPLAEVKHFGVVVINDDGRVTGFQEKPEPDEAKSTLVNTGIYVFEKEIFNHIPKDAFYDFAKNVFPELMALNKPLYGYKISNYWSDIGTINQYRLSSVDVLAGKAPVYIPYPECEYGWISETAQISPDCKLEGKSIIGEKTLIDKNSKLTGYNVIGNNCKIGKNVKISNSIIWDNAVIEDGAKLDGCIIAGNSVIGKNAVIMPGCVIPGDCHILDEETINCDVKIQHGERFSSIGIKA